MVVHIYEDRAGVLWIRTRGGLFEMSRDDPNGPTFAHYESEPGNHSSLSDDFVTSIHQDEAGIFWIGTYGVGINKFDRDGGTFQYATLDYKTPERNGHAHQLVGFDETWVDSNPRGVATYTNLSPGNYTFRVKGSNGDGVWNVGPSVTLVVEPPFWGTWWFRLLSLALVLSLVLAGHQIRTLSLRKSRERLRKSNTRLELEIAQRREAERKLGHTIREVESRSAEIETKNSEMERFVYTASHDLKTPLVTITGFLGMVEENATSGAVDVDGIRRHIERIRTAAEKMGRLLNEFVHLARVGQGEIVAAEVSLADLAHEVRAMAAEALGERGVEVVISPRLPVVIGDRRRLREAVGNLLHNAVKFMGDRIRPVVIIDVREECEGPVFFVRDNGIGIKPEFQDKIFDLFEQLDQGVGGTGIGLAVVKRIIEVHGGRVWVESEGLGHGCTFCFTLPGEA
jgi:signal transduction histidine kinase